MNIEKRLIKIYRHMFSIIYRMTQKNIIQLINLKGAYHETYIEIDTSNDRGNVIRFKILFCPKLAS